MYRYAGGELELFSAAINWKRYALGGLRRFAQGHVLEVGAGIGTSTSFLFDEKVDSWTCLEPDPALAIEVSNKVRSGELNPKVSVVVGNIGNLSIKSRYDTIFYIDVLEHISDDAREVAHAVSMLSLGGQLVVLSPAHQELFSEFDHAIGHFRRYSRTSLVALSPPGALPEKVYYLDSIGMLASFANRVVLKQSHPTPKQILFWDKVFVPISRCVDYVTRFHFGKTIVVVWRRLT